MLDQTDELARRVGAAIEPILSVRVAYVFGSRATGKARTDSDLDIGIVYRTGLSAIERERVRRDVVARLTDALGAVGERADVVDLLCADGAVAFAAIRGRQCLARSPKERVAAEVSIARRYDDEAPKRALFRKAAVQVARRHPAGEYGR